MRTRQSTCVPGGPRPWSVAVAVVLCLIVFGQPGTATPSSAADRARLSVDAPAAAGTTAAERAAVAAVDGFWRRHFSQLFGRPYQSPRVAGGYRGSNGPTCAGQPALAFNAFYCPSQDFLAWDKNLMDAGYQRVGDSWVYLIVAHEWGHAIQSRINRYQVSLATELQADCLAGATLAGAQRDGLIRLQPGDNQELAATLTALADTYPWTNRGSHGDAQQRVASYNLGVGQGVQA
ncbi:MAG TPA: neutral zinc metallopeptidase, partial [Pseudonocardia sp.]|uniref:neutral zinc metallopeptidase n=1 Tax=Pseudonocardia sp. TaxID=60912 RepID=UPI002B9523DA